jgi:dipeptidyl-peptidase-4
MKITHEDFKRSDRFLMGTSKDTWNGNIIFRWFDGGNTLAYRHQDAQGSRFCRVDTKSGATAPLFDHEAMAKLLSKALEKAVDAKRLPIDAFTEIEGQVFTVTSGGKTVICHLAKGEATVKEDKNASSDAPPNTAPVGGYEVRIRDDNLWIKAPDGKEKAITSDGVPHHGYCASPGSCAMAVVKVRRGIKPHPAIEWSPDGKRFIYDRLDERHVPELHLVQAVPDDGSFRPKLHTYRYDMPGDQTSMAEHFIYDIETDKSTPVEWPPMSVSIATPLQYARVKWSGDGQKVYLFDVDVRGKHLRLREADGATGKGRVVIDEEIAGSFLPTWAWGAPPMVRRDLKSGDLIWFSERSGWGHFYLYDGKTGALKHAITSGEWLARDILKVDEEGGYLYFTASGREPGDNVYSVKAYRARLDGSEDVELLTPEPGMHLFTALAIDKSSLSFAPNGAGFIDRMGGVDVLATWLLRAPDGHVIAELAREDASPLPPFTMPEPFTVKSADGKWDLHGVLLKPADFDPKRSYPVIEHVYPGPQVTRAPVSFSGGGYFSEAIFDDGQAYADLGFIVMLFDGRGNVGRSKAFRDLSYGAMHTASNVDDHVAALQQLAKDRPYLDLNRVGIFGASAGGFAVGHAMLQRPDHYKVGVAACGNHENRTNLSRFPETFHGLVGEVDYDLIFSGNLASRLKGKLMLVHGELDDNVHPAATMRLAHALIKAGRSFDMFIMPNVHHGITRDPYFRRYEQNYFLKHLMGAELPDEPNIVPAGGYAKKEEEEKNAKKGVREAAA